jgi:hypothetical protein
MAYERRMHWWIHLTLSESKELEENNGLAFGGSLRVRMKDGE